MSDDEPVSEQLDEQPVVSELVSEAEQHDVENLSEEQSADDEPKPKPVPPSPEPEAEEVEEEWTAERAEEDLRSNWQFACIVQFCRMFQAPLKLKNFSGDFLESALLRPTEYQAFLSELCFKLLRPDASLPFIDRDQDGWEELLHSKLAAQWRDFFPRNPLSTKGFYEISARLRTAVVYSLCEWRVLECPVLKETIRWTVDNPDYTSDALRHFPIGEDAKGHRYYYFSTNNEDCRLYREEPPRVPKKAKPDDELLLEAGWFTECTTLEEMQDFTTRMGISRNKNERALHELLHEQIMPKLIATADSRRKAEEKAALYEAMPKKRSDRIVLLAQKKVEDEAVKKERDAAERKRAEERARNREERRRDRDRETKMAEMENNRRQTLGIVAPADPTREERMRMRDERRDAALDGGIEDEEPPAKRRAAYEHEPGWSPLEQYVYRGMRTSRYRPQTNINMLNQASYGNTPEVRQHKKRTSALQLQRLQERQYTNDMLLKQRAAHQASLAMPPPAAPGMHGMLQQQQQREQQAALMQRHRMMQQQNHMLSQQSQDAQSHNVRQMQQQQQMLRAMQQQPQGGQQQPAGQRMGNGSMQMGGMGGMQQRQQMQQQQQQHGMPQSFGQQGISQAPHQQQQQQAYQQQVQKAQLQALLERLTPEQQHQIGQLPAPQRNQIIMSLLQTQARQQQQQQQVMQQQHPQGGDSLQHRISSGANASHSGMQGMGGMAMSGGMMNSNPGMGMYNARNASAPAAMGMGDKAPGDPSQLNPSRQLTTASGMGALGTMQGQGGMQYGMGNMAGPSGMHGGGRPGIQQGFRPGLGIMSMQQDGQNGHNGMQSGNMFAGQLGGMQMGGKANQLNPSMQKYYAS